MTADLAPRSEARLRAALDAAATTEPVDPAWEAIRARLEDGAALAEPRRAVPPLGRPRRRVLAAAVVLAVLAVGAAVVARTRPDGSTVVTDATTPAAPAATGWYVPVDLPAGWDVEGVTATRYQPPADRCDGRAVAPSVDGVTWVAPSRGARLTLRSATCLPGPDGFQGETSAELPLSSGTVDLGRGITGQVLEPDGADEPAPLVEWADQDRRWTLDGAGTTFEEVLTAARAAVAGGPLETTPAGFVEADRWTAPTTPTTEVVVTLTAPSGARMHYRLEAPGQGIGRGTTGPEPVAVAGQDLPVEEMWDDDGGWWAMRLAGFWPGADMAVMLLHTAGEAGPPAEGSPEAAVVDREVEELVGHLRPATTEAWRAFLAEVEHTSVLDEAATFADLAALDVPAPEPPPGGPPPTTTG